MSTRRRVFSGTPLTVRRPSPPAVVCAALAALLAGGGAPAAAQDRPPPRAPSEQPTLHVVRHDVDGDGVLDRVVVVRIRRGERVIDWGVVYSGATGERIISDRRETTSSPDLTGDGLVGQADIAAMLGVYGEAVAPGGSGDLDFDGRVDVQDLSRLLARFGQTPPAGGVPPTPLDCVLYCPGEPFPVCQGCGDADGGDSTDRGDGISTVGEGLTDDPDGTGDDDDGGGGFCCDTDGDGDPDDDDDGVPDSQDSSPEGCEDLIDPPSDPTTASFDWNPFESGLTNAANATPFINDLSFNLSANISAQESETCCTSADDPPQTPLTKTTYSGSAEASLSVDAGIPGWTFDQEFGFEVDVINVVPPHEPLGTISWMGAIDVGPSFEVPSPAGDPLFISAGVSGSKVAGIDCPGEECLTVEGAAGISIRASVEGSALFQVEAVLNGWEDCPLGIEAEATLIGFVDVTAEMNGSYNVVCVEADGESNAGFQGGTIVLNEANSANGDGGPEAGVKGTITHDSFFGPTIEGEFKMAVAVPGNVWTLE